MKEEDLIPYEILVEEAQELIAQMSYEKLNSLVAFLKASEKTAEHSISTAQKAEVLESLWNSRKIVAQSFDPNTELETALREKHGFVS